MRNVRLLTGAIFFYAMAVGILMTTLPQAVLKLQWGSEQLGLIGGVGPLGYALGCLACGRFTRTAGKRLLLPGVTLGILTMAGGYFLFPRSISWALVSNFGFGISNAFFFPVASSWMLESRWEGIGRTTILRHYNLAWTTGSAIGLYGAGKLCDAGWIFPGFLVASGILCICLIVALFPVERRPETIPANRPDSMGPGTFLVPLSILVAAILANLMGLGTRVMILVNYPELNRELGGTADQMGLFGALILVGQFFAFLMGALYEPFLGLRRAYVAIAVAQVASCLAFAYSSSMALLVPMALLTGLVMAMAFQAGIVAATGYFQHARTGTTFFEFIVGVAGLWAFGAGALVDAARGWGQDNLTALRTPFLVMIAVIGVFLIVQCLLVSRRAKHRVLLPETVVMRKQEE